MFKQDEDMLRYGALALDHLFIQDYLPAAPGDYVKVYLYGLYLSQHPRPDMTLADLAHELGLTENDVEAALRYWERRHLVQRLTDSPPEYLFRGAAQLALSGDKGMEADPAFVSFTEDVYALFDERRKVKAGEIALAWEWVQDMGLPQEIVMMLLTHMIAASGVNFSFKKAQEEAARMGAEHIQTPEDAEAYFAHSRSVKEGARAVLRVLGQRRSPSQKELDLYRKWTDEWKYAPEAVLAACDETVKGAPTFAYLDGILNGIRERAARKSEAPRSEKEISGRFQQEQREQEAVRAFAQALGFRTVTGMLRRAYERLCEAYAPAVVQLVAVETYRVGGDLERVEYTLERLRAQGIADEAGARQYFDEVHRLNQALQPLFEKSGHRGAPTVGDRTLYKKWIGWGFSQEMLLLAAEQAQGAARSMPYMDKILESWHSAGVTTPEQAARHKPAAAGSKRVSAQQYDQQRHTEEELANRVDEL